MMSFWRNFRYTTISPARTNTPTTVANSATGDLLLFEMFLPARNVRLSVKFDQHHSSRPRPWPVRETARMQRMAGAQRRKTRNEHSSGGVVIAIRDGAPHVALIATRNRTRWGLPKGAVDPDETSEAAALREVREETGLQARILRPLDTIEYTFRGGDAVVHKRVDFYL